MSKWQDIFSIDAWKIITGKAVIPDSFRDHIEAIGNLITAYHQLDKTDLTLFDKRITLLQKIEEETKKYLSLRGDDLARKKGRKLNDIHPYKKATLSDFDRVGLGSIDVWVESLHKRCQKKITHLELLRTQPELNRDEMKSKIIDAVHEDGKLYPGVFLEYFDLYHRPSEFIPESIQQSNYQDDKNLPMNYAFNEWLRSQSNTPFFLWLENHAISTAHRVFDSKYQKIGSVDYNPEGIKFINIQSLRSSNNFSEISESTSESDSGNQILTSSSTSFDSNQMMSGYTGCWKPYTPRDSVAFVWDRNNKQQFITHPHKVGQYHHSSLAKGNEVRFAGMWSVANGKITYLSNNSGHYRNSSLQFFKLVDYLDRKGVLSDNVAIHDLRNTDYKNKISLTDYLSWAEKKPEIQKYKQKKETKSQQRLFDRNSNETSTQDTAEEKAGNKNKL